MNVELVKNINAQLASFGDKIKPKEVTVNGVACTYHFKRLDFIDADRIRTAGLSSTGQFDPSKFAGNNARLVAATIVDPDNGATVFTYEETSTWPVGLVDQLTAAAREVNNMDDKAAERVAKNSEPTPIAAP